MPTKRFEAFREGLEDVAYLDRLRKLDDPRAKQLVEEASAIAALPAQATVQSWRLRAGRLLDSLGR